MAAEGQEVTAGAAAVLARRKDRPPLPRSLREAANEETSDEEWCAAEEQCEEEHEKRFFFVDWPPFIAKNRRLAPGLLFLPRSTRFLHQISD